ncbi:TerD family protein [Nocardia altamirensis]|uniref:TerD family protein n=1 Tax=Nocardia altamirensis TaxID=472158 RepID=UPI0008409313|nr:TerD family protein [Nocardia altamirensis]
MRSQPVFRIAHTGTQLPGAAPVRTPRPPADRSSTLRYVRMGLGWDALPRHTHAGHRAATADLDATALLFAGNTLIDAVYFAKLTSTDGSVRHLGDNRTGNGRGEKEIITVDLSRVPATLTTVLFVVTSYHEHPFDAIGNAFCRMVDGVSDTELSYLDLSTAGTFTGMLVAALHRDGDTWTLRTIDKPVSATHPVEAVPHLAEHLIPPSNS